MIKLRHKERHAQWKKMRRKKIRQKEAKSRDESELVSDENEELTEIREALLRDKEEKERERLHNEWLEREALAMKQFLSKETEKQKSENQEESECAKVVISENNSSDLEKTKEREDFQQSSSELSKTPGTWHNPLLPENFDSDKQNCPFFLKTGACRFGDRCSRGHPKPSVSCTILIPGMFSHFSIDKALQDEYDSDLILEYEDSECYQHFKEFYEDTLPEFKTVGSIVQFKVCCNFEPHLRGNVYVQYEKEEDAIRALNHFNGRWYAGRQLSCEFSPVSKWKSAICGLFHRNKCPKGRSCNFLHVFKNPSMEFSAMDVYQSPKDTKEERSNRSHDHSSRRSSRSRYSFTPDRTSDNSRRSSKSRDGEKRNGKHSRSSSERSKRSGSRRYARSRSLSTSSEESYDNKNGHSPTQHKRHSPHKRHKSKSKKRKHKKSR